MSRAESYGWECQYLLNGELGYGRRFVLRQDALDAAEDRQRLLGERWTAPPVDIET